MTQKYPEHYGLNSNKLSTAKYALEAGLVYKGVPLIFGGKQVIIDIVTHEGACYGTLEYAGQLVARKAGSSREVLTLLEQDLLAFGNRDGRPVWDNWGGCWRYGDYELTIHPMMDTQQMVRMDNKALCLQIDLHHQFEAVLIYAASKIACLEGLEAVSASITKAIHLAEAL